MIFISWDNGVVAGIMCLSRMYVRMFTFYHRSSDLIIQFWYTRKYDNTLNKFKFEHSRAKVKVTVAFLDKTLSSL